MGGLAVVMALSPLSPTAAAHSSASVEDVAVGEMRSFMAELSRLEAASHARTQELAHAQAAELALREQLAAATRAAEAMRCARLQTELDAAASRVRTEEARRATTAAQRRLGSLADQLADLRAEQAGGASPGALLSPSPGSGTAVERTLRHLHAHPRLAEVLLAPLSQLLVRLCTRFADETRSSALPVEDDVVRLRSVWADGCFHGWLHQRAGGALTEDDTAVLGWIANGAPASCASVLATHAPPPQRISHCTPQSGMSLLHTTRHRLRMAEVLSGVPTSNELRKRVRASVSRLSRPPSLVVVLVGDRADSLHYINHKRRAAAECGIALRLVQLPTATRQGELHKALAAVNNDVTVDGVLLQLPLPPHLRARPALFHIHPGKDVDGLHPLNAGNLFLQDRSPLLHAVVQASSGSPQEAGAAASLVDTQALSMTHEMMLLSSNDGGYSAVRRRSHESKFFVPCTALAIRTMLFSHLSRTAAFAHLRQAAHSSDVSRTERSPASTAANAPESPQPSTHGTTATAAASHRELHAVIVNKSMVVGVPTAALLQRAGGFVVSLCSRSNSLETIRRLAQQADVLITGYGVANVFDRSFVRDGAIVIDAAVNELPGTGDAAHAVAGGGVCGDVDLASVSTVASAITKTPGGVGPLTVSHLMANVLKAYELRHANHLYYNNIYTEFLKMYGTYEKVRDYAPHLAAPRHGTAPTTTAAAPPPVAAVTPVDAVVPHVELNAMGDASSTHDGDHHSGSRADNDDVDDSRDGDLGDDTDADNESYSV